jgi:hypothetical protein
VRAGTGLAELFVKPIRKEVVHMMSTRMNPAPTQRPTGLSAEMHNDRTHDSTVDTDGKNREAARLAGHGTIGPDEVTTSNATHDNSLPEARDGLAGFDSRPGRSSLLLALAPGYTVIEKGMAEPQSDGSFTTDRERVRANQQYGGRAHFALNDRRPTRIIELRRMR